MLYAGELTDLLELLKKYQIESAGTIIAIVVAYLLIKGGALGKIFSTIFEKYVDYFIKKKSKTDLTTVTLNEVLNHDIFSYIDFWRYSKVPTLKLSTEFRNVVFRKYLNIYLKSHKDKIQQYIVSKSYVNMTESELWRSLLSLMNDIVYSYETELTNAGIPKVVIEKMKAKNNDIITLTINLIENVCNSQFYKSENNLLKIYSVLNIILSILENTVQNSEAVCNSINGELKGQRISEGGKEYIES
jgi:hypothetical protein